MEPHAGAGSPALFSALETLMAAPAPLSPLEPKTYPALPPVAGVRFATIAAGVRYSGRDDVKRGAAPLPIVNAGNPNPFTGGVGPAAVAQVAEAAAKAIGAAPNEIFMA